ncbi:hypothetical protein [Sorangium sp. So ce854]
MRSTLPACPSGARARALASARTTGTGRLERLESLGLAVDGALVIG